MIQKPSFHNECLGDEISRAHVTAVNDWNASRGFPQSPCDPRLPVRAIATLPLVPSAPLSFRQPIIDPFANFQMLRRYRHDVTGRPEDDGARRALSAGITTGICAGRERAEEKCISQTSDLHQIDPLSQQDQLYARGVFLSSVRVPLSQRECARARSNVDSLRKRD